MNTLQSLRWRAHRRHGRPAAARRVELRIADPETGALLPAGEIGMIEVRGPNVFKGYWRMPEKTAAEFRPDGFFITGDLGMHRRPTATSRIVGRGKDLIITGGFNVYPKEVETEIDAHAGRGGIRRDRPAAPRISAKA